MSLYILETLTKSFGCEKRTKGSKGTKTTRCLFSKTFFFATERRDGFFSRLAHSRSHSVADFSHTTRFSPCHIRT